jgi:hypothetical protein
MLPPLPSSSVAMDAKLSILPPLDLWPISSVADEDMRALVVGGLLRPHSYRAHPEWLVPGDEQEPAPPTGCMVSFTSFHDRGFKVPASRLMRALPHYYGMELHNFNPNSIAHVAIFAMVHEGYLGIEPH